MLMEMLGRGGSQDLPRRKPESLPAQVVEMFRYFDGFSDMVDLADT